MLQIVQILGLAFLSCLLMSIVLGYIGIHVLKREVIFVDIALAQIAAVGSIAAHIVFEVHGDSLIAYACSTGAVLVMSFFYALARRKVTQISLEAIIGVSYAIAAAAALFLVGIAAGGHIHLQHILAGNLLWMRWTDIAWSLLVFSLVGLCFFLFRKSLNTISHNYQGALAKGLNVIWWDFLFYALLGIVVTLTTQYAGVVAVFAYLIIPATISFIFTEHPVRQLIITWTAAITASLGGLLFAYYLDFSVGPAVALLLGAELIIVASLSKFRRTCKQHNN